MCRCRANTHSGPVLSAAWQTRDTYLPRPVTPQRQWEGARGGSKIEEPLLPPARVPLCPRSVPCRSGGGREAQTTGSPLRWPVRGRDTGAVSGAAWSPPLPVAPRVHPLHQWRRVCVSSSRPRWCSPTASMARTASAVAARRRRRPTGRRRRQGRQRLRQRMGRQRMGRQRRQRQRQTVTPTPTARRPHVLCRHWPQRLRPRCLPLCASRCPPRGGLGRIRSSGGTGHPASGSTSR